MGFMIGTDEVSTEEMHKINDKHSAKYPDKLITLGDAIRLEEEERAATGRLNTPEAKGLQRDLNKAKRDMDEKFKAWQSALGGFDKDKAGAEYVKAKFEVAHIENEIAIKNGTRVRNQFR